MNTTSWTNYPGVGIDQDAELQRLVPQVVLTSDLSALVRGELLDLVATVWESEEEPDCFDVVLSVFEKGGGKLSLEGYKVRALGPSERTSRSGPRGDLMLDGLASHAEHKLRLLFTPFEGLRRGYQKQSAPSERAHSDPREPALEGAFRADSYSATAEALPALPTVRTYTSEDGKVIVTIKIDPDGETVIIADSRDVTLQGAVVEFKFVELESGREVFDGKLCLQPGGPDDLLTARTEVPPEARRPGCELQFHVIEPKKD